MKRKTCLVSGDTEDSKNKEMWQLVKERRANINSMGDGKNTATDDEGHMMKRRGGGLKKESHQN